MCIFPIYVILTVINNYVCTDTIIKDSLMETLNVMHEEILDNLNKTNKYVERLTKVRIEKKNPKIYVFGMFILSTILYCICTIFVGYV